MSMGNFSKQNYQETGTIWKEIRTIDLNPDFSLFDSIKNIPPIFKWGPLPEWFTNDLAFRGWNMSDEELNKTLPDWTKKLTHIDLDLWTDCIMKCPGCFKCIPGIQTKWQIKVPLKDVQETILKFKKLWLKTIKILWAWEPFRNKEIIPFLEWAHENWIGVSVFTKWFEIWDDEQVKRLFWEYGIHNSREMAKKLKELDVSVLIWLHSFDDELQKRCVWYEWKLFWDRYIKARNNAIVQLIRAWLNEYIPWKPTRLGISAAPLRDYALEEFFEIYKWARLRNIYPIACPSNNSWFWIQENERIANSNKNYEERLIDLYTKIYIRNIDNWITTLEEFLKDWPSIYPWVQPCKQLHTWWYMILWDIWTYEMVSCPWHDPNEEKLCITSQDLIQMTIEQIKEARKKSNNYNLWNYHCIARDGISLSPDFYDKIIEQVKYHYKVK